MHFSFFHLGSDDTTGYDDGVQALFQMMTLLHRLFFPPRKLVSLGECAGVEIPKNGETMISPCVSDRSFNTLCWSTCVMIFFYKKLSCLELKMTIITFPRKDLPIESI